MIASRRQRERTGVRPPASCTGSTLGSASPLAVYRSARKRLLCGDQSGITNVADGWRIQPVNATVWLNISAGVLKPSVFLGLSFNCLATALSLACE